MENPYLAKVDHLNEGIKEALPQFRLVKCWTKVNSLLKEINLSFLRVDEHPNHTADGKLATINERPRLAGLFGGLGQVSL